MTESMRVYGGPLDGGMLEIEDKKIKTTFNIEHNSHNKKYLHNYRKRIFKDREIWIYSGILDTESGKSFTRSRKKV